MDSIVLKTWRVSNDTDIKSKFIFGLRYDNTLEVVSLYKVKDSFREFYRKIFEDVGNYLSPEKIGEICLEMYVETMERIKDYDRFIDLMENIKHVEFDIEKEE